MTRLGRSDSQTRGKAQRL